MSNGPDEKKPMRAAIRAAAQTQPPQRSGELLAPDGCWTDAALRRIAAVEASEITWRAGPLAHVAIAHGLVLGNVHRTRPEYPWIVRVEGFQFWHEPTRVIKRWHYTPVSAAPTLKAAKRLFLSLIDTRPSVAGNAPLTSPTASNQCK